ncbi:hypothetical protein [Azospirillum sp. sgz302134]
MRDVFLSGQLALHTAARKGLPVTFIKGLKAPPREALAEHLAGQDLRGRNTPLVDAFHRDRYKDGVRFALDSMLIRNPIDLDARIDPTHLKAALTALNLETFRTERGADGKPKA